MILLLSLLLLVLLGSAPVTGGSLRDIEHVVIFMQENRSWDSYFGTMAGTRGFNDPNIQVNPDGQSVWHQLVDPDMSTNAKTLLPWYLGYNGGEWIDAIQCIAAGDNGYYANHAALNDGLNNQWARNNTPWSWGYYKRSDIPIHFALAEGWTSNDMYQESQITATCPNRVTLVSGSVNVPGGPQTPDQGGVYIDNNETPGCEGPNLNCFPMKWKTIYEFYEEAGVSWHVFQDTNNFDDNSLAYFHQFRTAHPSSPLAKKGMSFIGLHSFYEAAAEGTLPEVSFIVGPQELSEHPPWMPKDGAWLQKKVVDAVINSPKYNTTLLMISYDETGGFGDHVTPFHSPPNTPGDWMKDPYGVFGDVYVGPGFRLPFYMISPWTRGNRVFTERADHNSQILFVEEWLTARGYKNHRTDQMVHWRREHMSDLVNALNFADPPDMSLPEIPEAEDPILNWRGDYVGTNICINRHPRQRPDVPYGEQKDPNNALFFEDGFKEVIGYLTEGRFLVFEKFGAALTNSGREHYTTKPAVQKHDLKSQRWVIHYTEDEESNIFTISSALDGRWIGPRALLFPYKEDAEPVRITFRPNGAGYTLQYVNGGQYIDVNNWGGLQLHQPKTPPEVGYQIFSVTYHN
ncbi:phosphoesterase family-domain-containing protein [Penicillium capsulatum]|uniref:Phosphoesterase family-domain-containing protein n=1 Tax=Penicillium capsulatum TaxID=69766 RepID=A0A9W9I214_9EURO|nr:phosphoesterase family-domain-containing protein [Penicillium capsulatum]KAJ6117133.1 phosphoesterase family-domain-containing protein [Penicillium capsulatum]